MSDKSAIQWTEATWNPVTGCTKVSPGCAHCYIERTPAFRIHGRKFVKGETDIRLHENRLDQPLRWRRPRRIFVNSLSDLFHEAVPTRAIDDVFVMMALSPRHQFQVLTKRPARMRAYCANDETLGRLIARIAKIGKGIDGVRQAIDHEDDGLSGFRLSNVWLGVSVENQRFADERIPLLLQTPAAVRFISAEPLLGLVNLQKFLPWPFDTYDHPQCLDWVIVGGESGSGARPCDLRWVRDIRDQCRRAKVRCFIKQLGARARCRNPKGGDMAEWPVDLRVREYPV